MGCLHWIREPSHALHSCRICKHGNPVWSAEFQKKFEDGICSHCHSASENPIRGCFFEPKEIV